MASIVLSDKKPADTKIMIFAEGTILKPKSFFTLYNHKTYLPIGNAVSCIAKWAKQGAEIVYCTSRKGKQAAEVAALLRTYSFQGTTLYYRDKAESYKSLIEAVHPNILMEDDCKSIGGSWQMCITRVDPSIKRFITSIVVKEFKGIDHLPCAIDALQKYF